MKIETEKLKVFSYTNVIVEKNEPELKLPIGIHVFKNYDVRNMIGLARPRYLNGSIVCDIDLFEDCTGLYPGICFNTHPDNNLIYLSLGSDPNIDSTIKPL